MGYLPQEDITDVSSNRLQRANRRGELAVISDGGRTRISKLYQHGCAKIRVPKPQGNRLDADLINTSGGVTGDICSHLEGPFTLSGQGAMATYLSISPDSCSVLKQSLEIKGDEGSVSCWNGKLLARLWDEDNYTLRQRLVPLIDLLNGRTAVPKTWAL